MKALLLLWIGFMQSQAIDVEKFESMEACQAAAAALLAHDTSLGAKCLPYKDK